MGGENTMRQSVLSFSFSHYLIDRDRTQEYDRKAQQADQAPNETHAVFYHSQHYNSNKKNSCHFIQDP